MGMVFNFIVKRSLLDRIIGRRLILGMCGITIEALNIVSDVVCIVCVIDSGGKRDMVMITNMSYDSYES